MDLHHISELLPSNQIEVAEGYPLVGQSAVERRISMEGAGSTLVQLISDRVASERQKLPGVGAYWNSSSQASRVWLC